MAKEQKTNVMRILDRAGVAYRSHPYAGTGQMSGMEIAALLQENPDRVFKTLVTAGKNGGSFVFLVPVSRELDLKKAAAAVGEKAVSMLPQKELFKTTGYIHGGCSPIGMKKAFPTVIDVSAANFEAICFSAGKIGLQVELAVADISRALDYSLCDIVV